MRRAMAARLLLLLIGAAAAAGQKASGKGSSARAPGTVTVLGRLRTAMLEWYCQEASGHQTERPCLNYAFMTKMRAAESPEARKALIQERSKSMPSDEEGRKALAMQSRKGYVLMYKAYCAQPNPKNPEVCTNESLKKMYENFERVG